MSGFVLQLIWEQNWAWLSDPGITLYSCQLLKKLIWQLVKQWEVWYVTGPLSSCFSGDIYTFIETFPGIKNALNVQRLVSYKVLAAHLLSSHLLKDSFFYSTKRKKITHFEILHLLGFVLIPPFSTVVLVSGFISNHFNSPRCRGYIYFIAALMNQAV